MQITKTRERGLFVAGFRASTKYCFVLLDIDRDILYGTCLKGNEILIDKYDAIKWEKKDKDIITVRKDRI